MPHKFVASVTCPEGQAKAADRLVALSKLNDVRKVEATIRAVSQQDGDVKLIIDYGHEETATIGLWQVVRQ